jgi:excisionase family DNA binding protein
VLGWRPTIREDFHMASAELRETLVRPKPAEAPSVERLRNDLKELLYQHRTAQLVGPDGRTMALPESVFKALLLVVEGMAQGQAVTLIPHGHELTTQQAADLLHVSRPHLTKLLEDGAIPFHRVGTHRRVAIEDILSFREQRSGTRHQKIRELGQLSQELGGYK